MPVIFAKFLGKEILGEQGRILYSLLNAFATAGYSILLFDNMAPTALGKYGLMARSLPGVSLTTVNPERTEDWLYLHDREDRTIGRRPWRKRICVAFDIFAPYLFGKPLLMPYPLHPVHAAPGLSDRLLEHRAGGKKLRAFFSGATIGYTRNRIQYPKPKLPRLDIINLLLQGLGEGVILIQDEATLNEIFNGPYVDKCAILDTSKLWISDRFWLRCLAQTDFFLALPGITMPMCHNAIESMAVGAIPITNYPEWFNPPLEHLRNCIAFDDKGDLVAKLKLVLRMDRPEIAALREHVIDFYETHLTMQSFIAKIESWPDTRLVILMITEAYVASNASRLGRWSVLLRSGSGVGPTRWLRRITQHRCPN